MDQELIEMFEAMLEQLQDYEWVCGSSNTFTVEDLQEKLKELKSNE